MEKLAKIEGFDGGAIELVSTALTYSYVKARGNNIQQSGSFDSRYKFSAKEKPACRNASSGRDDETQYSYFGARYLDTDLSIWLSVDPLADKYPNLSPYMYCAGNPVVLVDPDGMETEDWIEQDGQMMYDSRVKNQKDATDLYGEGATYRKPGYSYIANDGSNIKLSVFGSFFENGCLYGSPDMADYDNSPFYSSKSQNTQTEPASNSGSSGKTVQTINTCVTTSGLITDATRQVAKIPSVGYNIAYNNTLLKGVQYLKPISYWATGFSIGTDIVLSVDGQQSWGETGLNTAVTSIAIGVGGWPGLILQTHYLASKAYLKTITEHPDWAPYPIRGFNH